MRIGGVRGSARWTILLVAVGCLIMLAYGGACAFRSGDDVRYLKVEQRPLELHDKQAGWGELPCVALTREFAYVAYDVREGYESHVYLCRVPRADGGGDPARIQVDVGGEIEFAPSISADHRGGVWVAWSSYRDGEWAIRATYVMSMQVSSEIVISSSAGFDSQVRVACKDGTAWFVSTLWDRDRYRIVASMYEGDAGRSFIVYEGTNPVSRPDLQVFSRDRAIFAWDEYEMGRFSVWMREIIGGELQPVEVVSGKAYGQNWEPHIAGTGKHVLVAWHRVPGGSDRCQPAAAVPGGVSLEQGIDQPSDHEAWRVDCFADASGATWIAWTSRFMYRSTKLYMRRIDNTGMSRTCKVDFPMQKNFINSFDCQYDQRLVMVWEYSGSIFLSEFDLPVLGDVGFPREDLAAAPGGKSKPEPPERLEYAVEYGGERLSVYFGDDHNHTSFSDGRAYPDISMLLARDCRRLDFVCVTDHDITLTPGEFAWNNSVADVLTEDGKYICLHGYEPSKGWAENGFGHWNLLFPGGGQVFQFEDGMTPKDLQTFAKAHGAVLIPHHVAKKFAPYNWDYFDSTAEPVVEMCSIHGIFESLKGNEGKPDMVEGKFIDDGLARGYRFGFIGASDFHNCFTAMNEEYGLTGVYAASLTSESVFEAIRKRRTFALTGSRIIVDFRCNGHLMGEQIESTEGLLFTGYAASPDSIISMEIISAREPIFERAWRLPEASFEWRCSAPDSEAYYYLRVMTARGDYAWSSPIWIIPGR